MSSCTFAQSFVCTDLALVFWVAGKMWWGLKMFWGMMSGRVVWTWWSESSGMLQRLMNFASEAMRPHFLGLKDFMHPLNQVKVARSCMIWFELCVLEDLCITNLIWYMDMIRIYINLILYFGVSICIYIICIRIITFNAFVYLHYMHKLCFYASPKQCIYTL